MVDQTDMVFISRGLMIVWGQRPWSAGQGKTEGYRRESLWGPDLIWKESKNVSLRNCLGSKERGEDCRKERACWMDLEQDNESE